MRWVSNLTDSPHMNSERGVRIYQCGILKSWISCKKCPELQIRIPLLRVHMGESVRLPTHLVSLKRCLGRSKGCLHSGGRLLNFVRVEKQSNRDFQKSKILTYSIGQKSVNRVLNFRSGLTCGRTHIDFFMSPTQ